MDGSVSLGASRYDNRFRVTNQPHRLALFEESVWQKVAAIAKVRHSTMEILAMNRFWGFLMS